MNVRRTFQPEGTGCTACKCKRMCERTQCVWEMMSMCVKAKHREMGVESGNLASTQMIEGLSF